MGINRLFPAVPQKSGDISWRESRAGGVVPGRAATLCWLHSAGVKFMDCRGWTPGRCPSPPRHTHSGMPGYFHQTLPFHSTLFDMFWPNQCVSMCQVFINCPTVILTLLCVGQHTPPGPKGLLVHLFHLVSEPLQRLLQICQFLHSASCPGPFFFPD